MAAELLEEVAAGGPRSALVTRARAWLQRHHATRIGVADVARACGVSSGHLSRRFAAECGEPPGAYLTALRVHTAGELLREPGVQVAEVARQLGYADPLSFTKAFTRWTGRSPSAWRAQP